jgi:hypothetical protein
MTSEQLLRWWHDPSLTPLDQHPIAHALGGLVFVALAAWLLYLLRHLNPGFALLFLLTFAVALGIAVPMVRDENDGRTIMLGVIRVPLLLTLLITASWTYALPWAWKPWALATSAQTVWELFQIAAWWEPMKGRSSYPTYSAVLDASTASLVAALVTWAAHPLLLRSLT